MVAPLIARAVAKGAAAKATVKKVAKDAAKKVTKEEVKRYEKARRSMKRSLDKVNRDIESGNLSNEGLQAALNFRESLEENIKNSYMIKSGDKKGTYMYSADRMENIAAYAAEASKTGVSTENMRKNEMFKRDINQASIGGVSTLTKEETKVFYTMTRELWNGVEQSKRNDAIIKAFGVDTLEGAWNIVMSDPDAKKAIKEAREAQKQAESDEAISDGSLDERDEKGSPPYIKNLITSRDTRKSDFNAIQRDVAKSPANWSASNSSHGMKQR